MCEAAGVLIKPLWPIITFEMLLAAAIFITV